MFTPQTCHVSHVTCHVSRVTCHVSRVICHVSRVTCHMSRVTCHVSHVTCHFFIFFFFFFFLIFFFFFFRTKWWSLSVEGLSSTGLPRLVLESTCCLRATVFCLFVYYYFDVCLPGPSWQLLKLSDASWYFIMLPISSCCLLTPPDRVLIAFVPDWHNIKVMINKQTKYCDSESHKHTLK